MAKKDNSSSNNLTAADIMPGAVGSTLIYQLLDIEGGPFDDGTRKVPCVVVHAHKDGRRGPGGHLLVHAAIFGLGGYLVKDVELSNSREPGTADTIQEGDKS